MCTQRRVEAMNTRNPRTECRASRRSACGRAAGGPIALFAALALLCNAGAVAARQSAPGPIDIRTATHFLEQATFGPTALAVSITQNIGLDAWLDQQFAMAESPMPDGLDGNQVRAQLFLNMANGQDQLRQRVMFALSQVIVVSANKTGSGDELRPWVRLLSRNAFGNYRTLLTEVTLSPTMGKYLDLAYSKKASATSSPNENYARELLQLFTIGLWELNRDGSQRLDANNQPIPTYTQQTIKEFARALTGWTFPTMPGATPLNSNPQYFVGQMEGRTTTHDTGAKTLLLGVTIPAGQTMAEDMHAVLDVIFQHPNVPPFVATRLIRSLVTSNPSPAYVERVANTFADNGQGVRGDLKALIKAVLTDEEALRFAALESGRLKDPVLHIIGLGRALGARITDPNAFMWNFSNLTQRVLTPATVFSFYSPLSTLPGRPDLFAPEFQIYPPALAIQRANFIYGILAGWHASSFAVDLTPFISVAATPLTLVNKVDHALMFGRMSNELRERLVTATTAIPASNTRERALGAVYLAALSSEYAVSLDNDGAGITTLQLPPPPIPPPSGGGGGGSTSPPEPAPPMPEPPPPPAPTTPFNLTGAASGSFLTLNWQNPTGAAAPVSLLLDVTGSIVATLPLAVAEHFSYAGVPPGTYTFTVRAVTAAGVTGPSNAITLTFGGATSCTSRPQTPSNLVATVSGNFVTLSWQPAAGPVATSFVVHVSGSYVGSFSTGPPTISGAAGPGSYTVTVQAVNACGVSVPSAPTTVVVP